MFQGKRKKILLCPEIKLGLQYLNYQHRIMTFLQNIQCYLYYPIMQPMVQQKCPLGFPTNCYWPYMTTSNYQTQAFRNFPITQNNISASQSSLELQEQMLEAEQELQQSCRAKRKYRKRREWLQKNFRCNFKGCKCKYSSKIALNSHRRKKHPKVLTNKV